MVADSGKRVALRHWPWGPGAAVALVAAALGWGVLHAAALLDLSAEQRALASRAQQLNAPALVAGSPLACLDAVATQSVATACEKAVFASPASVAAAVAYVTAQLALLSDMTAYVARGGRGIDRTLVPLRRALEADPYGFLAYVLETDDGCSGDSCPALAGLPHPERVRTNLVAQTLQHSIAHYRDAWTRLPGEAAAPAGARGTAMAAADQPGKRNLGIELPSADSIPPISIMNPEPKTPVADAERKRASAAQADPVWNPAPPVAQAPAPR